MPSLKRISQHVELTADDLSDFVLPFIKLDILRNTEPLFDLKDLPSVKALSELTSSDAIKGHILYKVHDLAKT